MTINYKIIQHVKTVNKGWHEIVFSTPIERIAGREFNELKAEHPGEYFELIKVEHKETCLAFTPDLSGEG